MANMTPPTAPPFCPNSNCRFHKADRRHWRFIRKGYFVSGGRRRTSTQRYRCLQCGRSFSDRTFRAGYWLKRPRLLARIARRLVGCSGYRQIARELAISPQTVARHAARLGRHSLLFHVSKLRGRPIQEPAALDSFQSFEYSQYYPTLYHLVVGRESHFCYGFTDSECRRSGRMTARQKQRRAELERMRGRPDPRSIEMEVAALLRTVAPAPQALDLFSDEHQDYPRAMRRVPHLAITHGTISSRAARIPANPLFAINLIDGLIRHSSANHKRESIAFSKKRESAIHRLWLFLAWRNYDKSFSEKKRGPTPAQRAGIMDRRWSLRRILGRRLFPTRIRLPKRWRIYYEGGTITRAYGPSHARALRYAM